MSKSRMMSSAFPDVSRVSNVSTRTLGLMSRRRASADWSLGTPTCDVPCRIVRCRFVWSTPQMPDVPVVHVHVDETAQASVVCKEVPPQGGVLAGQPLQEVAHARGFQFDGLPPAREGAKRRGDQDRDCHATVRSSMVRGSASNDARSSDRIHAFRSPALPPATAAITYTSRGHAWSRSYCEGMGGWSGC